MTKYKKYGIYVFDGVADWIEIGHIIHRLEKLEKQVAYLVNRIQNEVQNV